MGKTTTVIPAFENKLCPVYRKSSVLSVNVVKDQKAKVAR